MPLVAKLLQGSIELVRDLHQRGEFAKLTDDDCRKIASCLGEGEIDGNEIPDWNRIAGIEFLKRRCDPSVVPLFREYLSRPLEHFHKYIVPWSIIWSGESCSDYRCHPLFLEHRSEFASFLCDRFCELYSGETECGEWKEDMTVTIARSAAVLDPKAMILRIAPFLPKIDGPPLTTFLEALDHAAKQSEDDSEIMSSLKPVVEERLAMFLADVSDQIGNKPGEGARMLKLLWRCGEGRKALQKRLDGYYLVDRVFSLFERRIDLERK